MARTLQIMHVEDNDDHAELVSAIISQSNLPCTIKRFADAESATRYLFDQTQSHLERTLKLPDLVLLDLALPGISGQEFLQKLRADNLSAAIPVIVLTTSDREEEITAAYKAGANSYIIKPARLNDFVVKMTEMNMYWAETAVVPDSGAKAPID